MSENSDDATARSTGSSRRRAARPRGTRGGRRGARAWQSRSPARTRSCAGSSGTRNTRTSTGPSGAAIADDAREVESTSVSRSTAIARPSGEVTSPVPPCVARAISRSRSGGVRADVVRGRLVDVPDRLRARSGGRGRARGHGARVAHAPSGVPKDIWGLPFQFIPLCASGGLMQVHGTGLEEVPVWICQTTTLDADGIHAMVERGRMAEGRASSRHTDHAGRPALQARVRYTAPIGGRNRACRRTSRRAPVSTTTPGGDHGLGQLRLVRGRVRPAFEVKGLEDRGEHEVVPGLRGRHVLYSGRRNGFMPEYLDHPVKDMATWERDVKWRLAVGAPGRFAHARRTHGQGPARRGPRIHDHAGADRRVHLPPHLIGPERLFYAFYRTCPTWSTTA